MIIGGIFFLKNAVNPSSFTFDLHRVVNAAYRKG